MSEHGVQIKWSEEQYNEFYRLYHKFHEVLAAGGPQMAEPGWWAVLDVAVSTWCHVIHSEVGAVGSGKYTPAQAREEFLEFVGDRWDLYAKSNCARAVTQ